MSRNTGVVLIKVELFLVLFSGIIFSTYGQPSIKSVDFDVDQGFVLGNINGQQGWSSGVGGVPRDTVIIVDPDNANNQVLRMSNLVGDFRFDDQLFSPRLGGTGTGTGESNSLTIPYGKEDYFAGKRKTGATYTSFTMEYDFKFPNSFTAVGCIFSNSPSDGGDARQGFLRFSTNTTGLTVNVNDFLRSSTNTQSDFVEMTLGTFSKGVYHHLKMQIIFDAVDNGQGEGGGPMDLIYYYIDGQLLHVGPSWELFYEDTGYQIVVHQHGVPVQSSIWRFTTTNAACAGQGIVIDNFRITLDNSLPPCLSVGNINVTLNRAGMSTGSSGNRNNSTLDVTEALGLTLNVDYTRGPNVSTVVAATTSNELRCSVYYPNGQLSPSVFPNCFAYTPEGQSLSGGTSQLVCSFTLSQNNNGFGRYSTRLVFKPIGSAGQKFSITANCSTVPISSSQAAIAGGSVCNQQISSNTMSTLGFSLTNTNSDSNFECEDSFLIQNQGSSQFVVRSDAAGGGVFACRDEKSTFENLCSVVNALLN